MAAANVMTVVDDAGNNFIPGDFNSARFEVEKGFVQNTSPPSILDLVRTVRAKRNIEKGEGLFKADDWVEVRGMDMEWRIARLERVEERPRKHWDNDIPEKRTYYFFWQGDKVVGKLYHQSEIRAPEEGLKAVFGYRPWLWQQYAFIRLEALFRFEESHAADFDALNITDIVKTWFIEWVNDKNNGDFADKYRSEEHSTQILLQDHLFAPFRLMERIRDDEETWNFHDHYITIYSYLAVLGEGIVTVLLVALIQVFVPILLVLYTIDNGTEGEEKPRQLVDFPNNFCINSNFRELEGDILVEKTVLGLTILIYCLKVIPDTFYAFGNVAGISTSTYSRLNSLRSLVSKRRKDDPNQWIGFKLDRLMNTAYLNLLYVAMLFILFVTENVLDIILNALAIDFIHQIDETLASAAWWDPSKRWMTSGALQLVIRAYVNPTILRNGKKLCEKYHIKYEAYEDKFIDRARATCLMDLQQARIDEVSKERKFAEGLHGPTLLRDENEQFPHFGFMETLLSWMGFYSHGQFKHYEAYRVWSRWQEVIFMPEVPYNTSDKSLRKISEKGMMEFKPVTNLFKNVVLRVVTLVDLAVNLTDAVQRKSPTLFVTRLGAGITDWLSYVLPILFPFAIIASLFLYFICR